MKFEINRIYGLDLRKLNVLFALDYRETLKVNFNFSAIIYNNVFPSNRYVFFIKECVLINAVIIKYTFKIAFFLKITFETTETSKEVLK